jgi:hypothetical protein
VSAAAVAPRVLCEGEEVGAGVPSPPASSGASAHPDRGDGGNGSAAAPPAGPTGAGGDGDKPGELVRVPLHVLVGARSGDKGGDANVGLWADDEAVAAWLQRSLTTELFKTLLPEAAPFAVDRHPLPNLRAVNFVVHGILGWGVASNLRLDTQAKGLGELLRSRHVEVPRSLVSQGPPAERWAALAAEPPVSTTARR